MTKKTIGWFVTVAFIVLLQSSTVEAQVRPDNGNYKTANELFAKGERAPAANFTGTVWITMLVSPKDGLNSIVGSVTFEPGARTFWHKHPGGQILICTNGSGYYQEKGQLIQLLHKGDVVKIAPGIEHWHGATADSAFNHIAIATDNEKGPAAWLEPVTDEQYNSLKK